MSFSGKQGSAVREMGLPSPDRDRRLRSTFCIIADGSGMNDARHANDTQNKAGLGLLRDPREFLWQPPRESSSAFRDSCR